MLFQVPGNFHVSTHSAQRQPEKPDMTHVIHKVRFGMEMEAGKVSFVNHSISVTVFFDRFNPFMPSVLFYLNYLDGSISGRRVAWLVFIITMFSRTSVYSANCRPRSDMTFCGI